MPHVSTAPDHCQTAADVMRAAIASTRRRQESYKPTIFSPPPAAPQPLPPREPCAELPPDLEHIRPEIDRTAKAVAEAFEVTVDAMLQTLGDKTTTAALQFSAALCVRRLVLPREVVCEHFGIIDATLVAALRSLDKIILLHSVTRFAELSAVARLVHYEWKNSAEYRAVYKIDDIVRAVSEASGVSRRDIFSSRRTANIVRPRQIAMALVKHLTLRSLPEIGRRFGDRDHTTVLHACRKMKPVIDRLPDSLTTAAPAIEWANAALSIANEVFG